MSTEWILPKTIRNIVNSVSRRREQEDRRFVREVTLDGLDKSTKEAILKYLKSKKLEVTGVDHETYAVDLSALDVERHKEFVEFLESLDNQSEGECVLSDSRETKSYTKSDVTAFPVQTGGTGNKGSDFDGVVEIEDISDDEEDEIEYIKFPRTMHRPEEMEFKFIDPMLYPIEPYSVNTQTTKIQTKKRKRKVFRNILHYLNRARIRVCYEVCRCCWPPCLPILFFIFRKISRLSEIRQKRRMENIKKEEGFAIYSSIINNRNSFLGRGTNRVESGVNTHESFTYNHKGFSISHHDRATMTDPPSTSDVAINTPIFSSMPQKFSILTPEVLSLSSIREEQRLQKPTAFRDKAINAVTTVSNVAVTATSTPFCFAEKREDASDFGTKDIKELFSDPVALEDVEDGSIPEAGWGCPCEVFSSFFKGINSHVGTIPAPEDSSSVVLSDELNRHRSELIEVKRMLHSAIDLINKRHK